MHNPNEEDVPKKPETGTDKASEQKINEEHPDKKEGIIDKIKDALQDWSNDNAEDIREDNESPQRSGL